jgi:hypothetical protein
LLSGGVDTVAISELLTDLRHYCDRKALDFEELERTAIEDYQQEVSQSRMMGCA